MRSNRRTPVLHKGGPVALRGKGEALKPLVPEAKLPKSELFRTRSVWGSGAFGRTRWEPNDRKRDERAPKIRRACGRSLVP